MRQHREAGIARHTYVQGECAGTRQGEDESIPKNDGVILCDSPWLKRLVECDPRVGLDILASTLYLLSKLRSEEVLGMRTTQTWTVSLPPNLLREAERTAKEEDRTKSELVREALRMYIEERRWRKLQRETAARAQALGLQSEKDVTRLVHAGRK